MQNIKEWEKILKSSLQEFVMGSVSEENNWAMK